MTNDELRQEFEAFENGREHMLGFGSPIVWEAYQACNAKRQEEMAQMKESMQRWIDHHNERADKSEALLRECAFMLRHGYGEYEKASFCLKLLQQSGYGNDIHSD